MREPARLWGTSEPCCNLPASRPPVPREDVWARTRAPHRQKILPFSNPSKPVTLGKMVSVVYPTFLSPYPQGPHTCKSMVFMPLNCIPWLEFSSTCIPQAARITSPSHLSAHRCPTSTPVLRASPLGGRQGKNQPTHSYSGRGRNQRGKSFYSVLPNLV